MPNSMALAKRASDTDLMPPPPTKRMKRPPKVLTEEDYSADLDYIIARDYFPGLLEADAQQDYLDALEAGDEDWMQEAGQRVKAVMTPREPGRRRVSMTPRRTGLGDADDGRTPVGWKGATPIRTPGREGQARKRAEEAASKEDGGSSRTNTSLSSYQATYTSEDNTSFAKVIDNQNAKRREKYRHLWSGTNKLPSKQQLAQRQLADQKTHTKALAAPEYFSARYTGTSPSTALVKADPSQPSLDSDDRPAMIDKRPRNPRNGLFFNPDDMAETHSHLSSVAETAAQNSKAAPKAVSYTNTRVPLTADGVAMIEEDADDDRPASPTLSAVDAAMKGRPHPGLQKGGLYADSDAGETVDGNATPMVDGWKFVDADVPVEDPPRPSSTSTTAKPKEVDHDALLDSLTRHLLDDNDDESDSTNPYRIDEKSKRESLHHNLVAKQNAAKRAKKDRLAALKGQEVGKTPRFESSPRVGAMPKGGETPGRKGGGIGGLTPAGRALYQKIGGQTPTRARATEATPFGGRMARVTPVSAKR
ncbi:MAG: hypothetical protein Q9159_006146 [Coniocarpon cinnabarinum]